MVLTKDTYIPTEAELTVEEVPVQFYFSSNLSYADMKSNTKFEIERIVDSFISPQDARMFSPKRKLNMRGKVA
jgi:hypothetical protein